jgi:Domain of unknown function (DUF4411)
MGAYWLDADVLIQAKNTLYSFSIAQPFWDFLEQQAKLGTIRSSIKVYGEIMSYEDGEDDLVKWCKTRKASGLFCHPDKTVQETFTNVANYAMKHYDQRQAKVADFLKGGDGWIIAHAKCDGGTVVSNENRLDATALVPKIPNVCRSFHVGCINLPTMLTTLKFKFGRK